jgi:hypothetical protein
MDIELTRLAFALAQYHFDHATYPACLSELVPGYVATIPKDIFDNSDLRYVREGKGYVLYSVGTNGRDDGGRSVLDRNLVDNAGDWDDIVVRMPIPPVRTQVRSGEGAQGSSPVKPGKESQEKGLLPERPNDPFAEP